MLYAELFYRVILLISPVLVAELDYKCLLLFHPAYDRHFVFVGYMNFISIYILVICYLAVLCASEC